MTLRAYLGILRERWHLIAIFVLLALGMAVLLTSLTPRSYQASAQVFVSANSDLTDVNGQYAQQAAIQAAVSTYAQLIDTHGNVVDATRQSFGSFYATLFDRAIARSRSARSIPVTRPCGPTLIAAGIAEAPVPHPTSSTDHPGDRDSFSMVRRP